MMTATCPGCSARLSLEDEEIPLSGKVGRCTFCGLSFRVRLPAAPEVAVCAGAGRGSTGSMPGVAPIRGPAVSSEATVRVEAREMRAHLAEAGGGGNHRDGPEGSEGAVAVISARRPIAADSVAILPGPPSPHTLPLPLDAPEWLQCATDDLEELEEWEIYGSTPPCSHEAVIGEGGWAPGARAPIERGAMPFLRELPSMLVYPLDRSGPLLLVIYAALSWLSALGGPITGMGPGFLTLCLAALIVNRSAEDPSGSPGIQDLADGRAVLLRGLRALAGVLVASVPLLIFTLAGLAILGRGSTETSMGRTALLVVFGLPVAAFTLVYFPMALLAASVAGDLRLGANPIHVVRSISRIPIEYAAAIACCVGLGLASLIAQFVLKSVPVLGSALAALAASYFVLVGLHLLGRMACRCEPDLEWSGR